MNMKYLPEITDSEKVVAQNLKHGCVFLQSLELYFSLLHKKNMPRMSLECLHMNTFIYMSSVLVS